jgi:hypothetical protein
MKTRNKLVIAHVQSACPVAEFIFCDVAPLLKSPKPDRGIGAFGRAGALAEPPGSAAMP